LYSKQKGAGMLKFAKIAQVGDTIRAYDFKPLVGREDCFVEGVVKKLTIVATIVL
jgi:hypothetical protein